EAESTGRSIRAVLINDNIVTEDELTAASAEANGFPFVDLAGFRIDPAPTNASPLPMVLRHRVVGLSINDHEIVVGITDPDDIVALDDVRAATGLMVSPVVVARGEMRSGTRGRGDEGA